MYFGTRGGAVMEKLGYTKFFLAGHDREGRVAYRIAFDHPNRLDRVAVLGILPTWGIRSKANAIPV